MCQRIIRWLFCNSLKEIADLCFRNWPTGLSDWLTSFVRVCDFVVIHICNLLFPTISSLSTDNRHSLLHRAPAVALGVALGCQCLFLCVRTHDLRISPALGDPGRLLHGDIDRKMPG